MATQRFLDAGSTTDGQIKRGVRTLVGWIKYSHILKNLHYWINSILSALCVQQKYELLLEIALANMADLQNLSKLPLLYNNVIPIVILILKSVQHTPQIFHHFLKRFTVLYCNQLKSCDLGTLEETLLALMIHFPAGNEEIAAEYDRIVS